MDTSQSSVLQWAGNSFPASMLVDGLGLDGMWNDDGGCASTEANGIQWFSLELETPRNVTKVQIARRMHDSWEQGEGISIAIGSLKEYDSSDVLCLPEIPDLTREAGLMDYVCNPGQVGKFVTISKNSGQSEHLLTLCEVKVFVRSEGNQ